MIKFEIKRKDQPARIGKLKIGRNTIETPAFFPVINPKKPIISTKFMKRLGINAVITNAYIIYKDDTLRKMAIEHGIKKLLNFDGLVMTDSGAYQLMRYGDIDVTNREIIEFQIEIGSNIGVILDYPITIDCNHKEAKRRLEITKKAAEEGRKYLGRENFLLMYPIHGGYYKDIIKESVKFGKDLSYEIFGFGSIVPEAISYTFERIGRGIQIIREILPWHPLHIFGLGHPMFFSLAVLLGADTFDSASYVIFARDNRILTIFGTKRLEDLDYLPTSHPYWIEYEPKELLTLEKEERIRILSEINLYECILEINRIKQAIKEGRIWEYTKMRVLSNPYLLEAFRKSIRKWKFFSERNPISKRRALLYQGWETFLRAEINLHFERLKYYTPEFETTIILPDVDQKPYEEHPFYKAILNYDKQFLGRKANFIFLSALYGIIPNEVKGTYPLTQSVYPKEVDDLIKRFLKKFVEKYLSKISGDIYFFVPEFIRDKNNKIIKNFSRFLIKDISINKITKIEDLVSIVQGFPVDKDYEKRELWQSFNYQNLIRLPKNIFEELEVKIAKTGRIRQAYKENKLYLIVRAHDGIIFPKIKMAEEIKKFFKYPRKRVIISDDTINFVKRFKNVLAPAIIKFDKHIKAGEFVFVVDRNDNLIGIGESLLSGVEIQDAVYGRIIELKDVL